jgi:hypothetical protein
MEALERIVSSNDWVTFVFLSIIFMIVLASFVDKNRLKLLFMLPFDDSYRLQVAPKTWHIFNVLLFVASNLILALFVFAIIQRFYPDFLFLSKRPFFRIVLCLFVYWVFRYVIGLVVAYLFEIRKISNEIVFVKISYLFSSTLYLFVLLLFYFYYFNLQGYYLYFVLLFYAILLIIRYVQFLSLYKSQIVHNLFYFILYLCALEIAPLFLVIKIGI